MNFSEYQHYFQSIIDNPNPAAPYDNPAYFDYAKLNWSRMNRWLKVGDLSDEIKTTLSKVETLQHWTVITEPWCGDAAHIVPFFQLITLWNPLIKIDYQLRDTEPFLINDYLTNGGKAIPKLIIRDEPGKDLATWGPRPAECQLLYARLTAEKADFETVKTELQKWYNHDKGKLILEELNAILNSL
ncbi:MAG: thioredoxin family protein [Bacteroidota bacterium]